MPLPALTHSQAFVLSLLSQDQHSGPYIRDRLAEEGEKLSGPMFYHRMARMEEAGWISGHNKTEMLAGVLLKLRYYDINQKGRQVLAAIKTYYQNLWPQEHI